MSSQLTRTRWVICGLLFFATTVNYLDRQVLSILAPQLTKIFDWDELDYGYIVFAFQLSYAVAFVWAGRLIDWLGTRVGYAWFVGLWGIASAAHALASGFIGFVVARTALGLTEAGNFPAAIKTVSEWFPKKERALATGIFNSGAMLGAIIAPLTVPFLYAAFGWRAAFVGLGLLNVIWLVWWLKIYRSPQEKHDLHPDELAYIQSDPPDTPAEKLQWVHLFRYRGVWAFAIGKFLSDPIWWFFLFWLPKFLNQKHGLSLTAMGLPLIVIYCVSAMGSIGGGWLTARLMSAGWGLNAARKSVLLIAALAVVPVVFAAKADSLWLAVALISLATAAHCAWMANLYSLVSDIFPKKAVASVTGIGGTLGSIGGMLIALLAGWILQTNGAYWPMFAIAGAAYIVAWVIIHLLVPKIQPVSIC